MIACWSLNCLGRCKLGVISCRNVLYRYFHLIICITIRTQSFKGLENDQGVGILICSQFFWVWNQLRFKLFGHRLSTRSVLHHRAAKLLLEDLQQKLRLVCTTENHPGAWNLVSPGLQRHAKLHGTGCIWYRRLKIREAHHHGIHDLYIVAAFLTT